MARGRWILVAVAMLSTAENGAAPFQRLLESGTYSFELEGGLSGGDSGAARFTNDAKLDGERAFVVQLLTPTREGGVFLVFPGTEPPSVGEHHPARVELKRGADGYRKVTLSEGEVAILYYEMERDHMVLLGATGLGSVDVEAHDGETIHGSFDVELSGATGNPSGFMSVRPRRGRIVGQFNAERGKVEFRKP